MGWPSENAVEARPSAPAIEIPAKYLAMLRDNKWPETHEGLLKLHAQCKSFIQEAQADEMELRKLTVGALVATLATVKEGVNNVTLEDGSIAKATIKYNYVLKSPIEGKAVVDAIDDVIDASRLISNEAPFIMDRMIKWSADLSIAEYKKLIEESKDDPAKQKLLALLQTVVQKNDAAPTLEIKAPKGAK